MNLKRLIPILDWLPKYSKEQFRGDLPAGLTAGVLLIPQSIAFAMIAGVPAIYGLYASTIPMFLYAIFGTSRQLSVGPVSIVSLMTFTGVAALATPQTPEFVVLAILLALIVGVVQLLLGVFRLGFLVNFLSHPVVSGFTSASAIIIGLGQLKHLLGIKIERNESVFHILLETFQQIGQINWMAFGIGFTGILLIILLKKINKKIPSPLVAVIYGILIVWGFGWAEQVRIVGDVPSGLPSFLLPDWNWENIRALLPIGLAISIVSFTESIAVAKAMQARHKDYQVRANQELVALGITNIGGGFFQAFPTTGGFSRTAVNDQAGAKTQMASIISASLIVVTLLFLTPLFYYLPNAIVAAVIMVAVYGLIDFKEAVHLWHSDKGDFAMLMATFLATLFIGVEEGVAIGVILSLGLMIYRTTRPHLAVLGRIANTDFYKNINRFDDLEERPDLLIIRFDAQLYFANVNFFKETLDKLVEQKGKDLQAVIISAESINRIDSSGMHLLEDLHEEYAAKQIEIYFSNMIGPVRDMMTRAGLMKKFGKEHFFMNIPDAVEYFDSKASKNHLDQYILQTNVKNKKDESV
ncbi:MAG: solute carrier family 26 protein [Saprospiraceae bacterium]|nr:solute carrier family 26 protein [Saprospiraceae bacterium]